MANDRFNNNDVKDFAINTHHLCSKNLLPRRVSRVAAFLFTVLGMAMVLLVATTCSAQGSEYDALSPANCHDVVKQVGRIVDRIDATQDMPASRFKENQPSRVVDSPIGKVRQFGPDDRAGISYLLHVEKPGLPHVVRIYYPDCSQSCMQVSVIDPAGTCWQFQVHTGGEHPTSQQEHFVDVVCFPTKKDPALALFNDHPGRAASVSRVEVYELRKLPPAPVVLPPDGGRDIGLYVQHFSPLMLSFGSGPGNEATHWHTIADRLSSYMQFTGQNLFACPAYWYDTCCYPSKLFGSDYVDWPRIILDRFQKDGLRMIPQIYLHGTGLLGESPTKDQIAVGVDNPAVVTVDGTSPTGETGLPVGDPSDPRVREVFRKTVQELVDNYADSPALAGISLLIGKFLSNSYPNIRWGYGESTIRRFTKDTGVSVPVDEKAPDRFMRRYKWLMANAKDRWIQWRNVQIASLNEVLRRIVVEKRHGLELHLSYSEPRDVELVSWYLGDKTFHDLLREKGVDPLLARHKPGLILDCPYYTGANWRFKGEAYQTPHLEALRWSWLSPETNRLFKNGDQTAVWINTEPTERKGAFPDWWWGVKTYIEGLRGMEGSVATPSIASGRCFLEPYARALVMQDAKQIYAGGWSPGYLGNENLLREFAMEYRSLPKKTFRNVRGRGDHSIVVRELNDDGQHYVYAINPSRYPATATLTLSGPEKELKLHRISSSEAVPLEREAKSAAAQGSITLQPYQLMTFLLDPAEATVESYETRAQMPRSSYELRFSWGDGWEEIGQDVDADFLRTDSRVYQR